MKTKLLMLLFVFTINTMLIANNISEIEKPTTNVEMVKSCCSFSGNFKYNGKWEFGGKFTINFGLAGPSTNEGDNPIDFAEIILDKNATHGNYLVITPPKNLIGKTIEIMESTIIINQSSCGDELLQFINFKVQKGKLVLKDKTMIKIVNLPKSRVEYPQKMNTKKRSFKKN